MFCCLGVYLVLTIALRNMNSFEFLVLSEGPSPRRGWATLERRRGEHCHSAPLGQRDQQGQELQSDRDRRVLARVKESETHVSL